MAVLLTSSLLILALGIAQSLGPPGHTLIYVLAYSAIIVVGLFVAFYRSWNEQRLEKEKAIGGKNEAEAVAARASKSRDWNTEWKECADRFTGYINSHVRAEYRRYTSRNELILEVSGDVRLSKHLESLCRLTGEMLLASPVVSSALPSEIRAEPDAKTRWLLFLKARGEMRMDVPLYETIGDKQFGIYRGSIVNLAESSQLACIDCAANEFQTMRT